jgi:hypothetical protein
MINPEYFSRFGTVNDLEYLEKLLVDTKNYRQNTSKNWSYPFDDKDFDISIFMKSIEKMISDETQTKNKIALVFDKEKNIKCIAIGQFWNMIKSWRQCIILCSPNNSIFNAVDNGIADTSTLLISHAESIGYYSYDFIVANPKTTNRWNRMRQQIPIIKDRYEFFDEAIIPAGTMPSHPRYRQMMRNRTWNVDLLYRIGYLKNQYRKNDFLISL